MTFTPQDQSFAAAAEEYRRLWADEGSKVVEAMERGTGLRFLETHVKAVVFEGVSTSGGPAGLDEHRVLFLFLYDVWESVWGKEFADQQVAFESRLTGLYDYETAWKWALSLKKDERASRFADIVKTNGR